jgi:hypothetical protein
MGSKLFYVNLRAFLKDLNYVFPDDNELKLITSSLSIYCMDDTECTVINGFWNSLAHLEEYILTRDPSFFTVDHSLFWKQTSHEYQLFTKLNCYWVQMDVKNKKVVWDYIQLLYKLSKDYNLNN